MSVYPRDTYFEWRAGRGVFAPTVIRSRRIRLGPGEKFRIIDVKGREGSLYFLAVKIYGWDYKDMRIRYITDTFHLDSSIGELETNVPINTLPRVMPSVMADAFLLYKPDPPLWYNEYAYLEFVNETASPLELDISVTYSEINDKDWEDYYGADEPRPRRGI